MPGSGVIGAETTGARGTGVVGEQGYLRQQVKHHPDDWQDDWQDDYCGEEVSRRGSRVETRGGANTK